MEVTFNNMLRKILKLPWDCHTSILHCISSLQSLFVLYRSSMLCQKAWTTGIPLIRDYFTEAPRLSYTTFGFNLITIGTGEPMQMPVMARDKTIEPGKAWGTRLQNPSVGQLLHTNSTPILDRTALQQQVPTIFSLHSYNPCTYLQSILCWPTGSSALHLCTNLHAQQ